MCINEADVCRSQLLSTPHQGLLTIGADGGGELSARTLITTFILTKHKSPQADRRWMFVGQPFGGSHFGSAYFMITKVPSQVDTWNASDLGSTRKDGGTRE